MRWLTSMVLLAAVAAVAVAAEQHFAEITAVDAEKRTVTYTVTFGKNRGAVVTVPLAKDCVLKEGYYRLGKPATTKEGDDIAGSSGLPWARAAASTCQPSPIELFFPSRT